MKDHGIIEKTGPNSTEFRRVSAPFWIFQSFSTNLPVSTPIFLVIASMRSSWGFCL